MAEVYWVTCALCLGATWLAVRGRDISLSSGAGWVLLGLAHGVVIKPMFVYFDIPSEEVIDLTLFQQLSRPDYWFWGTALLLEYALFLAAMLFAGQYRRRQPGSHVIRAAEFSNGALAIFNVLAIAGAIGLFIQHPALLETGNKNSIATADLEDYSSGGVFRTLASLAYIVSLFSIANLGARGGRVGDRLLFAISASSWLGFCYLSDQRGGIVLSAISYVLAYQCFVRSLSRKTYLGVALAIVALVAIRTVGRLSVDGGALADTLALAFANAVGQNFIEHGKTVAIIQAVPHAMDYQYGKSYLDAILILIPREILPGKSTVNLDTLVGNAVFDCGSFGACAVPPGLVAESYLNFGLFGAAIAPVAVGFLTGWLDRLWRTTGRRTLFRILYVSTLVFFGWSVLGSGLASVITQLVVQIPATLFVYWVAVRTPAHGAATAARPSEHHVRQ